MRLAILVLLVVIQTGCGSIKQYETLAQPTNKVLTAGVGDVVLRIDNATSLPNVVGQADLWGRRTNTGFSQIRFLGMEPDGTIVLARRDLEIQSNETTMSASRNPFVIGASQGSATSQVVSSGSGATASSTANAQHVAMGPTADYHIVIPPDMTAIRIPVGTKAVPLAGHRIEIIQADQLSLTYRISQAP